MALAEELAAEAPEIDTGLDWIWNAWFRLGAGDRSHTVEGMAAPLGGILIRSVPGPIAWTAVRRWVVAHGISVDDAETLDRCVQAMDAEYRDWWTEKHKVTS